MYDVPYNFFFLMIRRPPRSTLFPTRRSSDLERGWPRGAGGARRQAVRRSLPRPFGCRKADRKSTRLNSSHSQISYAVFCLKKKKKNIATLDAQPTLRILNVTLLTSD